MKTVLCFGDSNTWGWNPATRARYARGERWPGVLRRGLGDGYEVIEEGQNGRTTVWDDPIEGHRNGREYFIPCLASHAPLDLVIIMLGTNDLKVRFSLSAYDIASGVGVLADIAKRSDAGPDGTSPIVFLIAPPPLGRLTEFADMFSGAVPKSRRFSEQFHRVAGEVGCALLDASQVVVSSDLDGVHLEAEEHRKLGEAVARGVVELLAAQRR